MPDYCPNVELQFSRLYKVATQPADVKRATFRVSDAGPKASELKLQRNPAVHCTRFVRRSWLLSGLGFCIFRLCSLPAAVCLLKLQCEINGSLFALSHFGRGPGNYL